MTNSNHPFEKTGCGKAPFKFIGCFEDRGPHKKVVNGVTFETGSPGQPMGSCKHCGTGIAICCVIQDAEGKRFTVGSSCVEKTDDPKLVREFKNSPERRAIQAKIRQERDEKKLQELDLLVQENSELFQSLPHSRGFINRDTGKPLTFADEVSWMLSNCGVSGKIRLLKQIKKAIKDQSPLQMG